MCTPSSQGKKSFFEVRTGIWVTVGKVLEREVIAERGEKGEEEGVATWGYKVNDDRTQVEDENIKVDEE